jgi:hypothetical protein
MIHTNFVVLDENCHWLRLMYLFLRHVVYIFFFNFAPGRNRTPDPRVREPKRTPLGYILLLLLLLMANRLDAQLEALSKRK